MSLSRCCGFSFDTDVHDCCPFCGGSNGNDDTRPAVHTARAAAGDLGARNPSGTHQVRGETGFGIRGSDREVQALA